jgi:peptide/nickel transport system permease protein
VPEDARLLDEESPTEEPGAQGRHGGTSRSRWIARKAAGSIGTLIFVGLFNFVLFRLLPGDPIGLYTRGRNVAPEQIAQLREQFDQPIGQQFLTYVTDPLGLGAVSARFNQPVWSIISERAWATVLLVGTAALLSSAIGTALGIRSAWERGGRFDRWATATSLTLYSMPSFWLGMLLLIAFSVGVGPLPGVFPTGGISSPGSDTSSLAGVADVVEHLALPLATLTLAYLAEYAQIMRASLLDELGQDYLTLARAKGLREALVRRRHAVRNALLPAVTLIFLNLGYVIAGAITVETVFSWPGLGLLSYEALRGPDVALLQALFLLFSIGVIVFTFLADVVYALLDPRVGTR